MQITHFGHACILAELPSGARLLFDPGSYSAGYADLTGLDAILITHEHPDHLDLERLPALLSANPTALVIADPGSHARLGAARIDHQVITGSLQVGGSTVLALEGDHAVIHKDLPSVPNNGYLIDDLLLHPGDSFTPAPGPVRILLVPAGGPWMKAGEGADYLRTVAPEVAIPIHQAGLASVHQQLHYQLFRTLRPPETTVSVLDRGVPAAF